MRGDLGRQKVCQFGKMKRYIMRPLSLCMRGSVCQSQCMSPVIRTMALQSRGENRHKYVCVCVCTRSQYVADCTPRITKLTLLQADLRS